MMLDHPCIRNVYVVTVNNYRFKPVRTLVIQTDLTMPKVGQPCEDERLDDVLECLEIIKEEAKVRFGDFEAVEIRGSEEPEDDLDLAHLAYRPLSRQARTPLRC
ncbi:MAG: hypothetical protein EOM26_04165 [Alphaproteobacteria bacterium]|nr:hypothetical protein [Alphaproteobacteria bacterium]